MDSSALAPTGLLCQLLAWPDRTRLTAARPRLGWIVNDSGADVRQTAYRIQVTRAEEQITGEPARWPDDEHREAGPAVPDLWDSGRVASSQSIDVQYEGAGLPEHGGFLWRVQTWNGDEQSGPWSEPQHVRTGALRAGHSTPYYPLECSEIGPAEVVQLGGSRYFIDFGRAAFGTVRLQLRAGRDGERVRVHLGERLAAPRSIDRDPPGCVRYRCIELKLRAGVQTCTVSIPPDERNTGPHAVRMPLEVGEVLPFRYCEVEPVPAPLAEEEIRQIAVHYPFDEQAASFACTDVLLERIWELCRYSIKATSFCGLYVDGDRERIPYEADAYINQLCHYAVDREFTLARRTHEYLLYHPTWPTEWILFSLLVAWADYQYTGNADSLRAHYADLRAKTLVDLEREDGLIRAADMTPELLDAVHLDREMRDIVDWPPGSFTEGGQGERDRYEMQPVNTVVNAFHVRALTLMSRIAAVTGHRDDVIFFAQRQRRATGTLNRELLDRQRGVYVDGRGSAHASLHASMFPLAFGLVPSSYREAVADFVESRGMACSVYGAQFLLEALYAVGRGDAAMSLMLAGHDRSWWNMLAAGSTVTLEAWDWKYKNNLDWNHAWGAAPANIIPRFVLGVRPAAPGFEQMVIQPQPGSLPRAEGRVPTIRGPVAVAVTNEVPDRFAVDLEIPANSTARVVLPWLRSDSLSVRLDGKTVTGQPQALGVAVTGVGSGSHRLERSALPAD